VAHAVTYIRVGSPRYQQFWKVSSSKEKWAAVLGFRPFSRLCSGGYDHRTV
jgi:hypothetical protein